MDYEIVNDSHAPENILETNESESVVEQPRQLSKKAHSPMIPPIPLNGINQSSALQSQRNVDVDLVGANSCASLELAHQPQRISNLLTHS